MKRNLLILFLFVQCLTGTAQTLTISTVEVCAGQEVLVPVTVNSLTNVAALTLYLGFDTNNLVFDTVLNIDPQLAGMSINLMTSPFQLAFAWSNPIPVSFQNGKLFDIQFMSNGSTAPVFHNPGCEIADPTGTAIPVVFSDGAVFSSLPVIAQQPSDTVVQEGGYAYFGVNSPNADSYLWRESQDQGTSWLALDDGEIYSGTHTATLAITTVPLSFNGYQYQCIIYKGNCQVYSDPAMLQVDELTGIPVSVRNAQENILHVSPVPFNQQLRIEIRTATAPGEKVQVFNSLGKLIHESVLPALPSGPHHIWLNTSEWVSGVYFVKYSQPKANERSFQTVKIIKNT